MKVALITGITGQDGSYLAELLLEKGYSVWGMIRRSSNINTCRIDHLFNKLHLRYGDLADSVNILNILNEISRENSDLTRLEVYNLGAMSHVKISFDMPEYVADVDGIGVLRLLEALRNCCIPQEKIRFYQASTSELYGKVVETPQTENYRESYGMYACSGILFNHESPRRGHNFVTRKITIALGKICNGVQDKLVLGNLDSLRDWGHSKDYVRGMWLMLQQPAPCDYVLSTNEYHSVREFVEKAFALKGFHIKWRGCGVDEIGYDVETGRELIFVSDAYFRLSEVDALLGDSSKARSELGWEPVYSFGELVSEMVEADS